MKMKVKKEKRTRKLFLTKLHSRNIVKGLNTWAVPPVKYSKPFLKWTSIELKQMDQKTRKLMTMHMVGIPEMTLTDYMYQEERERERERERE